MNPLDKEEFADFLKITKRDMPIHTDDTLSVKQTFSQGLPKCLKSFTQKVNNKFLNGNLHTIEEMEYRLSGSTSGFKDYQKKYFSIGEELNHDLYFTHENKIYAKVSGASPSLSLMDVGFVGSLFTAPVNGAELERGGTDNHANSWGNTLIHGQNLPTAAAGSLYDRAAVNTFSSSGTIKIGVYDDDGQPNNLLGTTGAVTYSTGYGWHSITEFSATTQMWQAMIPSVSSNDDYFNTSAAGTAYYHISTYAAELQDPYPAGTSTSNYRHAKIGHS